MKINLLIIIKIIKINIKSKKRASQIQKACLLEKTPKGIGPINPPKPTSVFVFFPNKLPRDAINTIIIPIIIREIPIVNNLSEIILNLKAKI
ncbi:MAG: hypothetical protein QW377_01455 [Candidatus Pacearchaeota archaeon]